MRYRDKTARELSENAVSALCFAGGILLGAWLARQWGKAGVLAAAWIYFAIACVLIYWSAVKRLAVPDECPGCGRGMTRIDNARAWCHACDITARTAGVTNG